MKTYVFWNGKHLHQQVILLAKFRPIFERLQKYLHGRERLLYSCLSDSIQKNSSFMCISRGSWS